jgi:hypothetical protein
VRVVRDFSRFLGRSPDTAEPAGSDFAEQRSLHPFEVSLSQA